MAEPALSRLRDRLPINPPYTGLVAEGYDTWIPVDSALEEEPVYRRLLDGIDGTILELGCGTGRPLLRWLAAGYDLEGIDESADMLAILAAHAAAMDLHPVVHEGDMAPLALDRTYAAIVCPAGTFMLVDDEVRASSALASYMAHLQPGGLLAMTLAAPGEDAAGRGEGSELIWRIRRTGSRADGTTIVVHEATTLDASQHRIVVYDRVESYDTDGRLQDTVLRRHHLRWWSRSEFESLLDDCGFESVRSIGDDTGWVAVAHAPAGSR